MSLSSRSVKGWRTLAIAWSLGMLAGCGGSSSTTPTPTTQPANRQTKTFTGVLAVGGDDHLTVVATGGGSLDATLTTTESRARPRLSVTVGTIGGTLLGQQSGSSAQVTVSVTAQTYVLHVENLGEAVAMPYTLTVVFP